MKVVSCQLFFSVVSLSVLCGAHIPAGLDPCQASGETPSVDNWIFSYCPERIKSKSKSESTWLETLKLKWCSLDYELFSFFISFLGKLSLSCHNAHMENQTAASGECVHRPVSSDDNKNWCVSHLVLLQAIPHCSQCLSSRNQAATKVLQQFIIKWDCMHVKTLPFDHISTEEEEEQQEKKKLEKLWIICSLRVWGSENWMCLVEGGVGGLWKDFNSSAGAYQKVFFFFLTQSCEANVTFSDDD